MLHTFDAVKVREQRVRLLHLCHRILVFSEPCANVRFRLFFRINGRAILFSASLKP
jgi:hypothetical protein